MSDSGRTCAWCGAPLHGTRWRRYCPRPRTCRQAAYIARAKARRVGPGREGVAYFGHEREVRLAATRQLLLEAVVTENPAPGALATAAADLERHVRNLVVAAVLAERAAGTPWSAIAEPFGLSADAVRHRYRYYDLRRTPAQA